MEEIKNTQPEGNGTPNEKTFTQEEVNKIISERLARERERTKNNDSAAADQRAQELTAKENRLNCKEYLLEKGYSTELLDCVDTSDLEDFKNKIEKIQSLRNRSHVPQLRNVESSENMRNFVAEPFKSKIPHKPRKY